MDSVISQEELQKVHDILIDCYGPFSRPVLITNKVRGPVSVSRHVSHIFQNYDTPDPLTKVVTTAIKSHCQTVGDCR